MTHRARCFLLGWLNILSVLEQERARSRFGTGLSSTAWLAAREWQGFFRCCMVVVGKIEQHPSRARWTPCMKRDNEQDWKKVT
jgi:hypothetical protein